MTKFKLVCTGFWPDGELDNGQKFFDANFDIVNVETGETVGETGRCGWDEANLRALDGAPCTKEGELIGNSLSVFLVKLKDPSCGNEAFCTVIAANEKRAKDIAFSENRPNGFTEVVSIRSVPANEEKFCWDFHPALDGY